ncbi:hypothetical protein LB504_010980 [Fusarium proliferatum]|nr:hypothetical protein LB504_010980 [Fusarium proliferatum]
MGSSPISSPSNAAPEPRIVSSPPEEPENNTPSIPERLWSKAYNILEEKEPDIVKGYQEILERVQNEWTDTAAPEELQTLEHCKSVKSRQMWRLVYSGLERSKKQAKVKESVSNIMETIDNLKGVVDKAVKYSSEASIAWAGVSLGLEILSNPMKEPGLNRKGIAYVLSRMEWYWNLAELVLQDISSVSSAALRTNLETQIIEFYKKLLLFQMRSACLYYRNWAGVILRDVVKLDDWAGELNSIKDAERQIRKDIEQEEARLKEKSKQDERDKDCLAALLVTDPRMDKKRIQSQKGDPLKESYEWILKSDAYNKFLDDPSSRVLWINGPPGKGKTMLLCGIIDELEMSLRPISFFLCQANVKEEDLSSDVAVIRGLIYVLLEHQPSLISELRRSYDKQKNRLFNSINSSELLKDILTTMLQDPSLHDAILLVDALDECTINRTKLTNLIVELSESCKTKWIAVKSYISKKVDDLAKRKWKNDLGLKGKVFNYMQSHADDTFLWVALVCDRLDNSGISKRLVIEELHKFPTSLTALYQAMMNRITNSPEADRLKQILALVCVAYRPITSDEIPSLVESMAAYDEDDVKDAIASCGSFLTLQEKDIFFVHQSAKEFLQSQARTTIFRRSEAHQHAHIFSRCLEAMENTLRYDIYDLGSSGTLSPVDVPNTDPLRAIKYSCVYWAQHLSKSEFLQDPESFSPTRLLRFFQSKFTNWLEALSLMNELSTAIASMRLLEITFAGYQVQDLADFIHDAHRFIRHHKRAIEIAPLQVYCAGLIFSPKSSVICQQFSYQMPEWMVVKPEMDDHLDHHTQTIYTHPDAFHASHSPDGCYLAVSHMSDFVLYRTASGDLVHREESPVPTISNVAFSRDGLFLCCSSSEAIFILCVNTLKVIQKLEHKAYQCFFFSEGNNIAFMYEQDVTVLNWKTGEVLSSLDLIIRESSNIALLTETQIVGIYSFETIKIWDLFTGDCKHSFTWADEEIDPVACSSDGRWIAAASESHIRLWHLDDTLGWVHKHDLNDEHSVGCLAFSENSRMLISGLHDIKVWDETGACVKVLKGHSQPIQFISVCGNQLASGSGDETVKLWDLSDIASDQSKQKGRSSVQTSDYSPRTSLQNSYHDKDLWIESLLFSPTGTTDTCTDILLHRGSSGLMEVSFTCDDKLVAMKDVNGKPSIWDTGVMKQVYFEDLEYSKSVTISDDGRYMLLSFFGLDNDRETVLKIKDLIKDAQTEQHVASEVLPFKIAGDVRRFFNSEDGKVLAIANDDGLYILRCKLGHWVKEQVPYHWGEIAWAFSPDNTWLLTQQVSRSIWAIREVTSYHGEKELESLRASATACDTPLLEKPWWRVATRYGLLAIGEPREFKGTARIGWSLSLEMDWIMRGNERMLWIPADYRRMALDINNSRVAFVCLSGEIKIMRFR